MCKNKTTKMIDLSFYLRLMVCQNALQKGGRILKDIIKPLTLIDYFSIEHEDIHKLYDRNRIRNNYLKIDNHTSREKISILFDGMWKAMIYNTNRLKYSCKLLSYYLNIPYGELLKSLSLGKNELDKRNINNKGQRADYVTNYENYWSF